MESLVLFFFNYFFHLVFELAFTEVTLSSVIVLHFL